MREIKPDERNNILKLQATLTKINNKIPCFFIVAKFKKMGLVREFGRTPDNKINWILTDKAKQFLSVQL